ncbi:MAG: MotA/TolQ/ExbB proton channel family protein [Bacteroidia bacterium]|nr:MotA/TolQ/ExbB proton channel family protein [Bacteroidia bacterium]
MLNLLFIQWAQGVIETSDIAAKTTRAAVELSFFDLAMKGGWIMIPIIALGFVAVYIFGERYYTIQKAAKIDRNFMDQIKMLIHKGKIDEALMLCRSNDTPVARMIEKGISRIGRPLNDVNTAIENVGNLEISKLEKGFPALASVSGGAPMLGFLGTVIGMVQAFYNMSTAGSNVDVSILSGGIYLAMVTTVAGLIVGITAYFAYNILVAKVESVVFKMEATTSEFMDLLHEPAK